MELPPEATVTTILSTLRKKERYVCGMLDNLHQCRKKHGNASVRIGTSGKGLCPYYRVVYDKVGVEIIFDTYFDNHTSFSLEAKSTKAGNRWSTIATTYDELANLRGTLKAR